MAGQREGRGCWLDAYPAEERLRKGMREDDPEAVLLVDIAGGRGHDLRDLRDRRKDKVGRLVLQDLPEVIADVDDGQGIECMVHDFFKEQPVKGES